MKSLKILLCLVGLLSVHAYADVECGKLVKTLRLILKQGDWHYFFIEINQETDLNRNSQQILTDLAIKSEPVVCFENVKLEKGHPDDTIVDFDYFKIIQ